VEKIARLLELWTPPSEQFGNAELRAIDACAGAAYAGADPSAPVTNLQVSFEEVQAPTFGDASHVYRLSFALSVSGKQVSGFTDTVFMQSGAFVADISHTALTGDATLTDHLAQTVADRLATANLQLPQ